MRRRDFLRGALAGAVGAASWPWSSRADAVDPVHAAFAKARKQRPWLLGYASAEQEAFAGTAERVSGALPEGLRGVFYRNGPAAHEVAGRRYQHWFDGDGLMQAFALEDGGVRHRARFIETSKRRREREAGRPLQAGFGTHWPDLPDSGTPDDGNVANISVLPLDDALLALWEGGSAYRLDPEALTTAGPWAPDPAMQGLPFSAHPRIEPDGTIWNFGSAPWVDRLLVYHLSAGGDLRSVTPIPIEEPVMIHDFTVTERYLVFVLPPLFYRASADAHTFLGRHRWDGSRSTRILLVEKADPTRQRWLEAPAAFVFHFANAFESGDEIWLDGCFYPNADLVFEEQRKIMWGEWSSRSPLAELQRWRLPTDGGAVQIETLGGNAEFPSIDPRQVGRRYGSVSHLARIRPANAGAHPLLDGLVRIDAESGKRQEFPFPEQWLPEEHVFVPASDASAGAGWLVGTSLDFGSGRTQFQVFDAQRVADGPVGVWRLPYALPLGLHGRFRAA
ncbi:MAG: carotenoid oxygenase family protein [Myxococcota bacterium]